MPFWRMSAFSRKRLPWLLAIAAMACLLAHPLVHSHLPVATETHACKHSHSVPKASCSHPGHCHSDTSESEPEAPCDSTCEEYCELCAALSKPSEFGLAHRALSASIASHSSARDSADSIETSGWLTHPEPLSRRGPPSFVS